MTQSKPVKKKKKTKSDKPKNEEKKAESTRPSTPMDKRKIAAENLREMIKEAHKMHKNHTRSLKGLSTPTSRDTIGKPKESEKAAGKKSNEGRYLMIEMTKRSSKTTKGGIEENTSSIQMKTCRRLSEETPKKEVASRKCSTESGKKIEVVSGRRGSAELERRKKDEGIPRGGSAVFPAKRRVVVAQRQGSAEFPVRKKDGEKARESSRKRREGLLKIKDYQVGSFVSLELLDKMKCHESDMCVRSRKSVLRPSRQDTRKPSETTNGVVKKSKKEEKRKKDVVASEKKSSSHKATVEKKRKVKKGTSPKRAKADTESAPVKRETRVISQTKSVISSPKSASSNLDSNISSITGGGDLFSSNTSRSYFSSESDISKIDKKFMQILEAVTQTKIGFEERAKLMAAEQTNAANLPSTSKNDGEETKKREPSELEQKLRDRISYLEQKLEKSKPSEENTVEKKKQPAETEKAEVTTKTGVDQGCVNKDNDDSQPPVVDKKPKDETASKSLTKYEGPTIQEVAQLPKPTRRKHEPVTEAKPPKTSEGSKGRESEVIRQETANKKRMRDDSRQTDKGVPEKGGEGAEANAEDEKNVYKRVETWSIIKRLEKAFQTLGLNLEDLDNSEEEEETSAKKKQHVKKHESSGQEKKVLPQSETLRRCQEAAQASASSTKKRAHASGDTPFVVETNGSGDKNTEYKRVRNSRKTEDLASSPQEKKSKDKTQKEAYYASVTVTPRVKISQGYDLNGLPDGKHVENVKSKSPRKRSGEGEKQTTEHGIIPKKPKPNVEESRSSKRYRKRPHRTNFDDWSIGHGKSKSDYSLSVSCSASSLSEEESKKCHKKKKKNHSLVREPYTRDEEVWTNTNGKGDAMSQTAMSCGMKMDREVQSDRKLSSEKVKKTNGVQATTNKTHKILKMEEESDELELKQIRQRHRQIISEIKLSLEEIKKQHNLCTKLRRQTKQFNRDCHAKRRMLASYLKDVETSYERRNGRHPAREVTSTHSRALSTDSYYYNKQKNKKISGKHSDCDMQMTTHHKHGRNGIRDACDMDEVAFSMFETDNETSTISEVVSSIFLTHTSTELALTDTAEESYRSMTSSLHTVCRKYKPKHDTASGEGIASMEMLCFQWEGDDKLNFSEDGVKQAPSYLVQLLQKLNKIIVTEKNQLEDLVVKASASSNRSTQSNKTKPSASAKSSGSSLHREQHHKSSGVTRPATTDNEMGSGNVSGGGSQRQHKSKGNKKTGRDKSPDIEEGIPISRSKSYIRGDPGGRSFDSLLDQDVPISESIGHRTDIISQCGRSCIHLEKHAEENRYRKGDPSFRSQTHILQHLGEHSRHCMEKVEEEEDDDAWKRKLEVDRILRVNERMFKRTTTFGRDTDTHALDYDPYIPTRGRRETHAKHRQQSIIIDHNRGEENEESQTVLGHASRHSGVTFGLRKHDRKTPHEYLKADRKTESSHLGRHHEKKGKKHLLEEVPINYCEIAVNTPGSSTSRLRDAYCQTDIIDDYDDIGDIYLLEEHGSSPSFN